MTVQELSDRLLELSHQHGLAQAEVCFVRDGKLMDVGVSVICPNLILLEGKPQPLLVARDIEEIENLPLMRSNQTGGDWVVRDKEPL